MPRRLLLAIALAACLVPAGLAATRTIAVSADERIGSFRVKSDGTLGGAVRAFGAPSALRRTGGEGCTATWRPIGLTIGFYNLGGADPCSRAGGLFGRAIMRGPAWRTTKGLRIGDPVARLRALYPKAGLHRGERFFWPAGYWLVTRANRFGSSGTYPGLLAETRGGRVVGFHVRYQAGGE